MNVCKNEVYYKMYCHFTRARVVENCRGVMGVAGDQKGVRWGEGYIALCTYYWHLVVFLQIVDITV